MQSAEPPSVAMKPCTPANGGRAGRGRKRQADLPFS